MTTTVETIAAAHEAAMNDLRERAEIRASAVTAAHAAFAAWVAAREAALAAIAAEEKASHVAASLARAAKLANS